MIFLLSILINAAVLMFVLTVFGQVKAFDDFMRPLAVVLYSIIVGAIAGWLLGDVLWGIPHLVVSVAALYFLIRWFFDLPRARIWTVLGAYFVIRFAIALVFV